jgi:hypothetical protein
VWKDEIAHLLLRELDAKLSTLGYHVAIPGGRRMVSLELMLYPAIAEKDRGEVSAAMRANDLRFVEKRPLKSPRNFCGMVLGEKEVWAHGRGKSERRVELFIQPA